MMVFPLRTVEIDVNGLDSIVSKSLLRPFVLDYATTTSQMPRIGVVSVESRDLLE